MKLRENQAGKTVGGGEIGCGNGKKITVRCYLGV